jgi:transcriptional regulator with XRE-family HTH domain
MEQTEQDSGLCRALRQRRHERKLTLAGLAQRLGMSISNLSRIEHGADFRVSTLLNIARQLKLEPLLVTKEMVPAVRAVLSNAEHEAEPGRFA